MPLVNPRLERLEPYSPGLSADFVAQKYNIPPTQVVKLASAENPYGPSPKAMDAMCAGIDQVSLYPEWTADALRRKIGSRFDVPADHVICGAGETEIISCIVRAFADPGAELLMHEPTFPIYHLTAVAEGRTPVFVPMGDDFVQDVDALVRAATDRTQVVFITSPHNPTGKVVDPDGVRRVATALPHALVVLDEAYIHYSDQASGIPLVHELPNLIVLRTFSKVYGLAGLRVGFGVAQPGVVRQLLRIKPTWNVGFLQVAGAIAALDDDAHVARTVSAIVPMREYLTQRINALGRFQVVSGSQANFVLVRITDPDLDSTQVFERLLRLGVIVKDCSISYRGLGKRFIRVDVSLRPQMDRFLDALAEV